MFKGSSGLFFFLRFTYLFLAALGLHCCMQAFSSCSKRGLVAVGGLLIALASLVVGAQVLGHSGSVIASQA